MMKKMSNNVNSLKSCSLETRKREKREREREREKESQCRYRIKENRKKKLNNQLKLPYITNPAPHHICSHLKILVFGLNDA